MFSVLNSSVGCFGIAEARWLVSSRHGAWWLIVASPLPLLPISSCLFELSFSIFSPLFRHFTQFEPVSRALRAKGSQRGCLVASFLSSDCNTCWNSCFSESHTFAPSNVAERAGYFGGWKRETGDCQLTVSRLLDDATAWMFCLSLSSSSGLSEWQKRKRGGEKNKEKKVKSKYERGE